MSQLTALIAQAQAGLAVQQNIPQQRWETTATQRRLDAQGQAAVDDLLH